MSGDDRLDFNELIDSIVEPWAPVEVARIGDTALRVAKIDGAWRFHTHPDEEELFIVLRGEITIDLPDRSVSLTEREGFIVPAGVRHRSRAEKPAWILLVEPVKTKTLGE